MEFSVTITHKMEILPIVKYWIPHLHVLEPEWIKDILVGDVDEFVKDKDFGCNDGV